MLGAVRYLADPKVNLDLNNLYKDGKEKTHIEEFGKNSGNDYIKVCKINFTLRRNFSSCTRIVLHVF